MTPDYADCGKNVVILNHCGPLWNPSLSSRPPHHKNLATPLFVCKLQHGPYSVIVFDRWSHFISLCKLLYNISFFVILFYSFPLKLQYWRSLLASNSFPVAFRALLFCNNLFRSSLFRFYLVTQLVHHRSKAYWIICNYRSVSSVLLEFSWAFYHFSDHDSLRLCVKWCRLWKKITGPWKVLEFIFKTGLPVIDPWICFFLQSAWKSSSVVDSYW